ncbi:glycosyltransferase family 8 protein [Pontibacter ramchanderi]|uniref:Lipopolysaccharide biosynthesis glycosyltransferase n=1 Tax=Pontibacter ramchanderi TaxID=1179743 RepID=A0A2N3V1L3_9BACT|nr:glycosyltransferase family 8 protein [Pontibacter ramchanderi]PKV75521.1 lipopolysaccharide biosynthesis glycosyltransferase [Pontibacter ramchanderi]
MCEYKNKIDVVFAVDENYIQHFCVAVTSLLENNCDRINNVYLLHDIQESQLLKSVISFLFRRYKKELISLYVNDSIFSRFYISGYISRASYYRLILSEVLPDSIEKVLYLDCDLIVTSGLDSLVELEFWKSSSYQVNGSEIGKNENTELFLYAVNEVKWHNIGRLRSLGLTGEKYFNAGVLLINLKRWRSENISKKFFSIALKFNNELMFHDQDILNIVFENSWGELNEKFNLLNTWFKQDLRNRQYIIIHYTGSSKPWHFNDSHPLKSAYWYYLFKTPFKFYIPYDFNFKNLLLKILKLFYSFGKEIFIRQTA